MGKPCIDLDLDSGYQLESSALCTLSVNRSKLKIDFFFISDLDKIRIWFKICLLAFFNLLYVLIFITLNMLKTSMCCYWYMVQLVIPVCLTGDILTLSCKMITDIRNAVLQEGRHDGYCELVEDVYTLSLIHI